MKGGCKVDRWEDNGKDMRGRKGGGGRFHVDLRGRVLLSGR